MKYDEKKLARLEEQLEQKRASLRDLSDRRNESLSLWRRREAALNSARMQPRPRGESVPQAWAEGWEKQKKIQENEVIEAKNEYERLVKEIDAFQPVVQDLGTLVSRLRSYVGKKEEDKQVVVAS